MARSKSLFASFSSEKEGLSFIHPPGFNQGCVQCKMGAQGCSAIILQQFTVQPVDPAAI
jgi:hypothetical protein